MPGFYDDDPTWEHYVFVSAGEIFESFLIWMKPQSNERKVELNINLILILQTELTYFLLWFVVLIFLCGVYCRFNHSK